MSKRQRIKGRLTWLWGGTWKRVRAIGISLVVTLIFVILAIILINAWESGTALFRNALLVFMDDSIVLRVSAAILSILLMVVFISSYVYFTDGYSTESKYDPNKREGFTDADYKTLFG